MIRFTVSYKLNMFNEVIKIVIENPIVVGSCALIATIPIGLYMWYFLNKESEPKMVVMKTFFYGCFSVIPLAILQYFMTQNPDYNVYDLIKNNIANIYLIHIATFSFVGLTEEYVKHWVVKIADDKDKSFRTVVDGIELSIIAALGFSFIEHIVYFVGIYFKEGVDGLIVPYIFRGLLTTLAHCCFSGIYGYYYGRSHFLKSKVKKDIMVIRGLISAMVLHAIFNFVLEINMTVLIVPLLLIELGFIIFEFNKTKNREIMVIE